MVPPRVWTYNRYKTAALGLGAQTAGSATGSLRSSLIVPMSAMELAQVVASCMVPCRRESTRPDKVRHVRLCPAASGHGMIFLAFHGRRSFRVAIPRHDLLFALSHLFSKNVSGAKLRGVWQDHMSPDFATFIRRNPAESKSPQHFPCEQHSTRRGFLNPDLAQTLAASETSPSHPR
jgi:hypothetical protein